MTTKEYCKTYGLVTEEDIRNHFREKLREHTEPLALYSCIWCDVILWDYPNDNHTCEGKKEYLRTLKLYGAS